MADRGSDSLRSSFAKFLGDNLLVLLTVVGVIVGLGLGLGVREARPSPDVIMWMGLAGEMYMRMLKMMILPLIIATVITGTASLNPRSQGRVSLVAVLFIVVANTVPPIIGALVIVAMNPGSDVSKPADDTNRKSHIMQTQDIFADLIRNLFPDNLITAAFQQTITTYGVKNVTIRVGNDNQTIGMLSKSLGQTSGTNVLGLIICCTLFGVATSSTGHLGLPFLSFFKSSSEIILKILKWLIWFTPVGVASLIATVLASTPNLEATFKRLGIFIGASVLGLSIFIFILIPAVYVLLVRQNPLRFFVNLIRPMMICFAASSSAIAIPDTLFAMEKKNKIDKRISRFVVPFSSALNKSGSALYIAGSCVFVCQLERIDIDASRVMVIIILTALSTFAIPSVPSAGIVTILILLTSMNVSTEAVGLLLAIEWFLDRYRTLGNLFSQILCVAVTQKFSNLPPEKQTPDEYDQTIEVVIDDDKCISGNGYMDKSAEANASDRLLLQPVGKCSPTNANTSLSGLCVPT